MRQKDIFVGGVYSNGNGRVRKVIGIGPEYKFYESAQSKLGVRYEVIRDGSKGNSTAGSQFNMSLPSFASWAKECIPSVDSRSEPNIATDAAPASGRMSAEEAIKLLQQKLNKYHPCDKIAVATQMAIEALQLSDR